MKERRCRECGEGVVRMLAKAGRVTSYRNLAHLAVPVDLEIPTCTKCGSEWMDKETAERVDARLDDAYRTELRERTLRALDALAAHATQRRLEQLLDLSHGYLSKLRSGEKDPSPSLVTELALLAHDPQKRLNEIAEYWGQDLRAS